MAELLLYLVYWGVGGDSHIRNVDFSPQRTADKYKDL